MSKRVPIPDSERPRVFRALDALRDQMREGWQPNLMVNKAMVELIALQESRRPCVCPRCDEARVAFENAVFGGPEVKPSGA